ncbi:iron-containing alcohol dehydrogenase [Beduini massiliensis]|uniref:iron-containing alcohol dehydrogenase n=1 Tax=Beduini massiliensis TaxID=1585974 RepID=UPI000693AD4A|nr:iron-containing alcohol dehydrogenase [Beduini massiliensis]
MINFEYQNPTKVIFGKGVIDKLSNEILNYGNRVLLVYGGNSIKDNGTYDCIVTQLKKHCISIFELGGVKSATLDRVYEGIEICKQNKVELVVGIGGGTCIDVAKSIALGAANQVDIWDVLTGKIPWDDLEALPIGAVVTIAGSGSEMDGNSEIDHDVTGVHGSIGSFIKTYPSFAVLDPELTYSIPFQKTAYHGVEIMIQALEQYFCDTRNTPIQDGFIETICKVVMEALKDLKHNQTDYNARSQLMWASALVTNRILGRGKGAKWMAGPLSGIIDEKAELNYTTAIAITFPKYMMVCCKDHLSLFKQFAINVMGVNQEGKTCLEIAYEGALKLQEFFDDLGLVHCLKDMDMPFTTYQEFESEIEKVAKRNIISKEDLQRIVQLSIGGK